MAHGITEKDQMFSYRETPWHGLGVVLDKRPKSIDAALKAAGLDWTVEQHPLITIPAIALAAKGPKAGLIARAEEFALDGWVANVRSDTQEVLGVVTPKYEPFNNRDAFGFADHLLGESIYETAGSLWGGKQTWVLLRLPEHIEVGGDRVMQFMYLRTRHDGTGALWVWPTMIRVVCANTDRMAIDEAGGVNSPTIFKIRHIGDQSIQVAQARKALGITVDYAKQFKKAGNKLASQKMTERKLAAVLGELYPGGTADATPRTQRSVKKVHDTITELFLRGDTIGNAPGSKWSAWNSIVEYDQHDRSIRSSDEGVKAERRFFRSMEDPDGVSKRALALVTAS